MESYFCLDFISFHLQIHKGVYRPETGSHLKMFKNFCRKKFIELLTYHKLHILLLIYFCRLHEKFSLLFLSKKSPLYFYLLIKHSLKQTECSGRNILCFNYFVKQLFLFWFVFHCPLLFDKELFCFLKDQHLSLLSLLMKKELDLKSSSLVMISNSICAFFFFYLKDRRIQIAQSFN